MILLCCLALATEPRLAPVATPPERPVFPELEEYALSSGTPVIFARRDDIPMVQIKLGVTAEYADLEQGELLATLATELLGTDTQRRDATAWQSALQSLGARVDLRLTQSRLSASLRVPRGREAEALALVAEALFEPRFRRKVARIYLDYWTTHRETLEYRIHSVHERAVNHAFFPIGHSLRHASRTDDLGELTARDAEDLVARVLREGRASLSVAGDADVEELMPLLEQHFGQLRGDTPAEPYQDIEGQGGRWLIDRTGFEVAKLTVALEGPPAGHPDEAPVRVLWGILAGSFDSRMSMDLREQRGLTYGVHGDMRAWTGLGMLRIDLDTALDDIGEAFLGAEEHLDQIEEEGVSQAEVDRAMAHLLLEQAQDFSRIELVCQQLLLAQAWSLGLDIWDRDLDALEAVTPADVAIAARKWLVPERRIWVITGSGDWIAHQLEEIDRVPDHVITAEEISAER